MFTVGPQEMIVIVILALVLFGPKKLPELGRTIGKALTEFRRASSDLKASFEREMHNLEREVDAQKEPANTIASAPPAAFSDYEYPYYDESYGSEPAANSSTVSASEVPGAESNGSSDVKTEAAAGETPKVPAVEGTVARSEATPQHS